MSALDDAHATIRKLKNELRGALDEIADLRARLDYAEGRIRELRAKLPTKLSQTGPPQ
jgi:hypothetical protein